MNAIVSVVIPVHNGEKFLRECLDTVVGQTLKELEIICVNDGSTDGSLAILEEYASRDSRVRIISQEASNAGRARNTGLAVTTGEYLSFLDADDWFELDMLESMVKLAKETDSDVVFCKAATFNQKTGVQSNKSFSLKERLVPKKSVFSGKDIAEDMFQFCRTAAWDKLYKASFIKGLNLQFQEQPRMNDCFFSTMANLRASRMVVCNKIFIHYRINTGNSITSNPEKTYPCILNTFKLLQSTMTSEEYSVFGKSWKNFVMKNAVNEMAFFPSDVAKAFYDLFKDASFNLNSLPSSDIYDQSVGVLYKKYFENLLENGDFKENFELFRAEQNRIRKKAKWKKMAGTLVSTIRSRSMKALLKRILYFIG